MAITENGQLVIIGKSGEWLYQGFNRDYFGTLCEEFDENSDIQLTAINSHGDFVQIFGKNGYATQGIPKGLSYQLKKCHEEGKEIYSVSFSEDKKSWAIIWNDFFWGGAPDDDDHRYVLNPIVHHLRMASRNYGQPLKACVTNKGIVICCRKGCYYNNIPLKVAKAIHQFKNVPKIVAFTDSGAYFISDGETYKFDFTHTRVKFGG